MLPNIILDDLKTHHSFSVRTYNICLKHKLTNLERIINHYVEQGTFINLEGCGRKSELELTQVCNFYFDNKDSLVTLVAENKEEFYFKLYQNLSVTKIQFLEKYYLYNVQKLEQRAQNTAVLLFKNCNNSFSELYLSLQKINFKYSKIPNVGKKSKEELEIFYTNFFEVTRLVSEEADNNAVHYELFLIIIEKFIAKDNHFIRDWLKSTKQSFKEKNFPILYLLDLLIKDKNFLPKRKAYILKHYLNYFKNTPNVKLIEVADKFNISKERARQIALPKSLEIPFWDKVKSLLATLPIEVIDLEKYEIDTSLDLIIVAADEVNNAEKTNFSLKFIFKFLSLILPKFQFVDKNEFTVSHSYLVKKEVLNFFDVKAALSAMNSLLEKKIEASFNLNLKGFLSDYLNKSNNWNDIDRIINVYEKILFEEYGILTDFEGNITIEKNTHKAVYEYIIEIMEEYGQPLHVEKIFSLTEARKPGLIKSIEAVRGNMTNHSNIFINTAWSTYGLKKWEEQGLHIGGSIKDVVDKYLIQFDEPRHIHSIAQFVLKYRDTTAYNIYSNLQSDPHNRFTLFGFGFVGLGNKEYAVEKTKFKGIPPNAFRNFKKDYFRNKKSVLPIDYLIKVLALKNNVKEVQMEYSISKKIAEGKFYVKDNFLMLAE